MSLNSRFERNKEEEEAAARTDQHGQDLLRGEPGTQKTVKNLAHVRQSRPVKANKTIKAKNLAHIRQSRPDSGRDFAVKVI